MTTPISTLFYDPIMLQHNPGRWHPESPARLEKIYDVLQKAKLRDIIWKTPKPAELQHIRAVHSAAHVANLEQYRDRSGSLDPDTVVSPLSIEAAYVAAGAAVDAVDWVLSGQSRNAVALTRPPGHHAEANRSMGFCLLNNIAIAAEYALKTKGIKNVLIVDWDVHHGNGTQHIFEDRNDVLYFSTHRFPFYPGTGSLKELGRGPGTFYTVNVPLPPKMDDGDLAGIFAEILLPLGELYKPELILISAGFDAHKDDPIGGMSLTDEGFATLCGQLQTIAEKTAKSNMVLILEGGYDLVGTAESMKSCVSVLTGSSPPPVKPLKKAGPIIQSVKNNLRDHWQL